MALKLDLSKAYDCVEWGFLRAMMTKMGFDLRFIDLVFAMVSSVRYKIIHGGHELGLIIPKRGIRQGDPLSPYLFLICAEGFSSLIRKFERDGRLKGCKVANGAPVISHTLFADNSYVYCRANDREASNMLHLLQLFEIASGQQVNFSKPSVFFSTNVPNATRDRLCGPLRMRLADEHSTYLGLPCVMGRNKDAILGFLKDKMQKHLQSWEGHFLSTAGREILIKTVAQALPCFAMSVFLLPLKTCSQLESLMAKYWWPSSSRKGVSWFSWRKLCKHKKSGGNLSFIWRSVFESQTLIRDGARPRIGPGSSTEVLNTPWLLFEANPCVVSNHPALVNCKVSQLMQPGSRQWDLELIEDLFDSRDVELIKQVPLSVNLGSDSWFWNKDPTGFFTVKSAYAHLQSVNGSWNSSMEEDVWKMLWKIKVPPKVLHFARKALSGCLPTRKSQFFMCWFNAPLLILVGSDQR
ncbi:hypothetical protein CsatA_001090 [Cannabis sativa]